MKLDWKDGLLFAFGFVLSIAAMLALESGLGVKLGRGGMRPIILLLAFGPLGLRRAIWGAPHLPEPRRGALYSLLSVIGLFATFAGVGTVALGGLAVIGATAPAPDFAAEARALDSAYGVELEPPNEAPAARAARLEKKRVDMAESARRGWEESSRRKRNEGLAIVGVGILCLSFGSIATWARYRRA